MRKIVAIAAAVAGICFANHAALAAEPFSDSMTPTITLGFQFGNVAERTRSPAHFIAQFDIQSRLYQVDGAAESATRSALPLSVSRNVILLNVFALGTSRDGLDSANVLGRELLGN
jgi:hypothetical protein